MKIFIIALAAFCIFSLDTQAQTNWGEDGEIENAEIVIEKEKVIELPEANRYFEKVSPPPAEPVKTLQEYRFKNFNYQLQDLEPRIRVLTMKQDPLDKLYGNYVKGGIGNYLTTYLEGFFNNKRSKDYSYGVYAKHLSSYNGPVDNKNSGDSENLFGFNGKFFKGPIALSGDISYLQEKNHFYGYNRQLEFERNEIKQVFRIFTLQTAIESNLESQNAGFKISPNFYTFSDDYNASELQFWINGEGRFDINDDFGIHLETDLYASKHKDESSIARNLFRVKPYFSFVVDPFRLQAGFNVAVENDTIKHGGRMHFYPYAKASYDISDDIIFYAGIDGDVQRKTLRMFAEENPWLGPNTSLANTLKNMELFAGIGGKFNKSLSFQGGFAIANLKNLYYFVNSASDSAKFDIIYDTGNTSFFNLFGEMSLAQVSRYSATLRGDYYSYGEANVEHPWHKPQYQLSILGNYNLKDKIQFYADLYLLGGMKGFNAQSGTERKLKSIADLDLKADYLFSSRFSAFLSFNNILSSKNERFLNYPSRGVMVMAGATYSF